jgi:hypothetical protein
MDLGDVLGLSGRRIPPQAGSPRRLRALRSPADTRAAAFASNTSALNQPG